MTIKFIISTNPVNPERQSFFCRQMQESQPEALDTVGCLHRNHQARCPTTTNSTLPPRQPLPNSS